MRSPPAPNSPTRDLDRYRSHVRGCLLGGAIGDALGGPVEFWSLDRITSRVGPRGVRDYLPDDGLVGHTSDEGNHPIIGHITDDTQMTLFTVEGLIRATVRSATRGTALGPAPIHHAYDRWLDTQLLPGPGVERPGGGWLVREPWL
ncbi:ADP-ribosylglycohydrolase family protein [Aestuariimicrobium soli]|uniref:ADP-ribosylglycohydrolase family protein n=1 Tax=Aestuariimicrobium soli TaxID=2035834 RepID=UPI003EBCA3ED